MPFDRPDFQTLLDRALADIQSRLPDASPQLRRSLLGVVARMHSGAVHGLYGYLDWLARQAMPDTAEAEHLERWGSWWGVTRKAASRASGEVTVTGTSGAVIPAGTMLARADGATYATTAEVAVSAAGTATAPAVADEPGQSGNADAGLALTLVTPLAGVRGALAAAGFGAGADEEADASLLARLLARVRNPPQGGAEQDYEAWALGVAGVTRVWVAPQEQGPGTVVVRIMTDDSTPDGIPTALDVAAVQAVIEAARPVTAEVTVVAPLPVPLDMTVRLAPNTAAVRAAVQAEVTALIRRQARPGGTIPLSHLREAISVAPGETDHQLVSPAADVAHGPGEIAVPGAIVWEDM
jgi:uncharacterized phage protein gp47/JayE